MYGIFNLNGPIYEAPRYAFLEIYEFHNMAILQLLNRILPSASHSEYEKAGMFLAIWCAPENACRSGVTWKICDQRFTMYPTCLWRLYATSPKSTNDKWILLLPRILRLGFFGHLHSLASGFCLGFGLGIAHYPNKAEYQLLVCQGEKD
jgi:hypothetical protein